MPHITVCERITDNLLLILFSKLKSPTPISLSSSNAMSSDRSFPTRTSPSPFSFPSSTSSSSTCFSPFAIDSPEDEVSLMGFPSSSSSCSFLGELFSMKWNSLAKNPHSKTQKQFKAIKATCKEGHRHAVCLLNLMHAACLESEC
ncbi:hypothetical protein QQP08_018284 [Theobroma cacao]|nr:hypothetical protein QQP08_018284 [Theobroma cacao]